MNNLYTIENAEKFNWSSVSGQLNPERVSHLDKYLIGKKILDAGCGGGAYVEFLSQKNLEVTGVDKYEHFLQVARQKGKLGTYIQADITNLPFPDKVFDCTYCYDVLEHIDDQAAIKELIRVTSKRLIVAVPQEDEIMKKFNLTFLHYQDKTHLRNYTENSLKIFFK
ncbi:class I SAM-dependent methyltransferase [Tolypothrix bouteillei]|uniref:Class I SAM-dependent methyltransferase n=1 Tax=Tolypothrix bouteillei VB521301 TaxID=1479485 RepID=A0A8S9T2J5_9CYAN|nr:class I SAM-dependent methyltransferase [Tolypothrix bouteillei]KAF3885779.1 class I SAM-dependent methyltransferase [Tolypothrix bouteillei VB521301]